MYGKVIWNKMLKHLTKRREPFTFMLWMGIAGSCVLFLFVFFVFLRKEFLQQDIPVHLPKVFWWSSLAIVISEFVVEYARKAFRTEQFSAYRTSISLCFILALLFLCLQFYGWKVLLQSGITMARSTAGSFIFILSGLHLVHTLVGLIGLVVVINDAFRNLNYVDAFIYSVNAPNQLRLKLFAIYWHFLGLLWVVIFLFLLYHAQ